ncbi:lytic transglycosylase domain-containing protein [Scopulibacillus cellulosilyticus]|uniref:Lytic transglycosylase domain-containing protein n=1 Tax=Scopulibacillus cellulosilyticus TaxID=2665665 RepID=A0ABW2PZI6_9BACL
MINDLQWIQPFMQVNTLSGMQSNENDCMQLSSQNMFAELLEAALMASVSENLNLSPAYQPNELLMHKLNQPSPLKPETKVTNQSNHSENVKRIQPTNEHFRPSAKEHNGINAYINEAAKKYNVDPKLLQSVIKHESGGNTYCTSPAGAQGLMQLMPDTARALGVSDPYDPKQNIEGGAKYLRHLLDQFNNDPSLALAAYNAGPGNVQKFGGIPPFKETQNYVKNVLATYYHEI